VVEYVDIDRSFGYDRSFDEYYAAEVVTSITCDNGIIHIINGVLRMPSDFASLSALLCVRSFSPDPSPSEAFQTLTREHQTTLTESATKRSRMRA
jgi:hypothetical protein